MNYNWLTVPISAPFKAAASFSANFYGYCFWSEENGELHFCINCGDEFVPGADCERVSPEEIFELKAITDKYGCEEKQSYLDVIEWIKRKRNNESRF